MGRNWIHAALAGPSRFVIDLHVGPRTLESAAHLMASVAVACRSSPQAPLLLVDDHLPYPAAMLQVFGLIRHRRRKRGHGRRKYPDLKPLPGLLAGVVEKRRDDHGNLLGVRTRTLFGRRRDIQRRIRRLHLGDKINTAHIERLNGTLRGQQARLTRRTRSGSRREDRLQHSLWLWRDLYNWTRGHGSLSSRSPAMVLGLSDRVWTVQGYLQHPVHASDLDQQLWEEEYKTLLTSPLEERNVRKLLPAS
jgi:hypothetical protein